MRKVLYQIVNSMKQLLLHAFVIIVGFLPVKTVCVTVIIDPEITYQTFEGWGTSLCWWANSAGGWDKENFKALIGAIVDPDTGLGYTCFRYNIGGGDHPSHTHMSAQRAMPGFKPTEDGDYDWSADKRQRNILIGIADRIDNPVFEAFSNSPPWWMTVSGCASGNTGGADNLKPEYFTAFADYLATVVKHYKEEYGITFATVEPFNEPSSGYWKPDGGQEGCGFRYRQSEMIVELGNKLKEKNLFPVTSVSAADETSIEHMVSSLKAYTSEALSYISQINSHSYDGWNFRDALHELAREKEKKLWQSESGPLGKKDNSDIAMWMSDVIIQDLRVMKPAVWIDWQVCDPHPDWRSIEIDNTRQRFTYNKRYFMHAAFSRFIRPGARFIHSSDNNSVAALVPETGNLVIILRNASSHSTEYVIDLSKCDLIAETAAIHRFELPGSLSRKDNVPVTDNELIFTAPGQTITTCVISDAIPTSAGHEIKNSPAPKACFEFKNNTLILPVVSSEGYMIMIYNSVGQQIKAFCSRSSRTLTFDTAQMSKGIYTVEVRTPKGTRYTGKIILAK